MLKSNMHYFKASRDNREGVDMCYMMLDWVENLDFYVEATKKIKELVITIKTLEEKKDDATKYYEDLHSCMLQEYGNKSEFNCFVNACDSTISTLQEDISSFKEIVRLYIKHRTISEYTPKEWIQALVDKGASRSKGQVGNNKLASILSEKQFNRVYNWKKWNLTEKAYTFFSKNTFNVETLQKELKITIPKMPQGKLLDVLIKKKDFLFLLEAKHIKEGGGAQDKQIKELIDVISLNCTHPNVYFGAFLDGMYSNKLLNISDAQLEKIEKIHGNSKIATQQRDIISKLKSNANAFWFNTHGFTQFINDIA